MDANFWLKSRLRGSINRELTLGLGWSYFVNNGPYSDFIKDYINEDEVRISDKYMYDSEPILTPTVDSDVCWFSGAA